MPQKEGKSKLINKQKLFFTMDFLSYLLTYKNVRVGPHFVFLAKNIFEMKLAVVLLYIHIHCAIFQHQDCFAFQ